MAKPKNAPSPPPIVTDNAAAPVIYADVLMGAFEGTAECPVASITMGTTRWDFSGPVPQMHVSTSLRLMLPAATFREMMAFGQRLLDEAPTATAAEQDMPPRVLQ